MRQKKEDEEDNNQYRTKYRSTTMTYNNEDGDWFIFPDGLLERHTMTPVKTNVRKWLAGLFVQSVRAAEQSLEGGHLATAAAMFASATMLTDRSETFTDAVQRMYPCYFYRLYEHRMVTMGYGHLFPETTTTKTAGATIRGRSSIGHRFSVRSIGPVHRPPSPAPITQRQLYTNIDAVAQKTVIL